ncbi:MAG: GtrA family protein [Hyphomonadaceae bacterium]
MQAGPGRTLATQFLRFAIVGAIATGVHYAVLVALVEGAGVAPLLATTCGYAFGIATSYTLNRRFTFGARGAVGATLAKFVLLYAIGAALNGAVMAGLIATGAHYLAAQVGATALVLIWNFAGARYVVFRD